jgi:RNA polymerase sigma-70 factor (ECF subfamily)
MSPVEELERHRGELTSHCTRMLGSAAEAEDAVQEALVRAWRGLGRLERRATLRAWLYRIATNVCLDMLAGQARRPLPVDPALPEAVPAGDDPAEIAARREMARLAMTAALRHLAPRQRAALILCEVLRLRAAEAAELTGSSVASVTSALQRARAALAARGASAADPAPALRAGDLDLLRRYLDALARDDVRALASLASEDVARAALAPACPA